MKTRKECEAWIITLFASITDNTHTAPGIETNCFWKTAYADKMTKPGQYGTPLSDAILALCNVESKTDDSGEYAYTVFRLKPKYGYKARTAAAKTIDDLYTIDEDAINDERINADEYGEITTETARKRHTMRLAEAAAEKAREAVKAAPEPAPEQDAAQDAQTASKPAKDAYTASELIRRASRSADALPHSVSITVPGTIGSETASDARRDAETETVMTALSSRFGGCTATPGRGSWIDGTGNLIAETVTVCTSYADSITPEDADFIGETARSLCARMAQDCVTITIDGLAAFVSA